MRANQGFSHQSNSSDSHGFPSHWPSTSAIARNGSEATNHAVKIGRAWRRSIAAPRSTDSRALRRRNTTEIRSISTTPPAAAEQKPGHHQRPEHGGAAELHHDRERRHRRPEGLY